MVPTQDAFTTKVNTTNDLKLVYTDFTAIPNTANSALSTSYSSLDAAAVGYIYFDDGKTLAQLPTRFDIYVVLGASANQATINVNKVLDNYPKQNQTFEQIGVIRIMNASQCNLNGSTSSTVTLTDAS